MNGFIRSLASALVAAALLLTPTVGWSATCRHDGGVAATSLHATTKGNANTNTNAIAPQALCGDHSTSSSRPADTDADCAGACALTTFAGEPAQPIARLRDATLLIASVDRFAAGLAIPPPLGPPRL